VRITGLKEAVNKHTRQIDGGYSFVLDGAENEFVYVSENSPEIESSILTYHKELNFSERSAEAKNNICQLTCDDLNCYLVIKKLATNLFLGIFIEQDSDKLSLAMKAMTIDFTL
jgi:hypothetical protein